MIERAGSVRDARPPCVAKAATAAALAATEASAGNGLTLDTSTAALARRSRALRMPVRRPLGAAGTLFVPTHYEETNRLTDAVFDPTRSSRPTRRAPLSYAPSRGFGYRRTGVPRPLARVVVRPCPESVCGWTTVRLLT